MSKRLKAVVTAGSTVGRLDAVRFCDFQTPVCGADSEVGKLFYLESQNIFTGALGLRIAEALNDLDIDVTLLTRTDKLSGFKHSLTKEQIRGYYTYEELAAQLPILLEEKQPDLIFMAAAVSDYVPTEIQGVSSSERGGKIKSDEDELVVKFTKTKKLIDGIRPLVGSSATIVGFKLQVAVTKDFLQNAALKQLSRADSDLCIANDLKDFTPTLHPAWVVTKDGSMKRISGSKAETAKLIVEEGVIHHKAKQICCRKQQI